MKAWEPEARGDQATQTPPVSERVGSSKFNSPLAFMALSSRTHSTPPQQLSSFHLLGLSLHFISSSVPSFSISAQPPTLVPSGITSHLTIQLPFTLARSLSSSSHLTSLFEEMVHRPRLASSLTAFDFFCYRTFFF